MDPMSYTNSSRDHGGNLDAAIAHFGGSPDSWLDLSTGINPDPYPVPPIRPEAWAILPRASDMGRLVQAAREAYRTDARIVPTNGAQGAIQAIPWLRTPCRAAVISPTYNEHAAALRSGSWQVSAVTSPHKAQGADLAVVVNPNNPDGRRMTPEALVVLAGQVGLLVVDESFADPEPELSVAPRIGAALPNVIVLRSFGKFFGLAGIRLGFAIAHDPLGARLADLAGPWPVSGPAIAIACAALADTAWQERACRRLRLGAARLDALAKDAGWQLVGGSPLFRTYAVPDAVAQQDRLARHRVWTRVFPYSSQWIRVGLPPEDRWPQLEQVFQAETA